MIRFGGTGQLDDRLEGTATRREVLRRLGGLGLVAVGVGALRLAGASAAVPTISNALLQISVTEPPVLDPGQVGAKGDRFENPFTQKATIKVTATVNFSRADLRAMRDGEKYRLGCQIWENDNDNQAPEDGIDQFVFGFPRLVFPKSLSSLPSLAEPVRFETTVTRSSLDLDQPNPNGDEIVALLILTTPSGERVTRATNLVKLCPCQP